MIKISKPIYFDRKRSVGPLLGFSKSVLAVHRDHLSDAPVDINKFNVIRVECNIIGGSYLNGSLSHTLHEFAPEDPPGYKIIEVPSNVIYLPVTVKRIGSLSIKLVDQSGDLIDFRGETITLRILLKLAHNAYL